MVSDPLDSPRLNVGILAPTFLKNYRMGMCRIAHGRGRTGYIYQERIELNVRGSLKDAHVEGTKIERSDVDVRGKVNAQGPSE